MTEDQALPAGWAKATVGSLVSLTNGFAFKPSQWKQQGTPIIRIQNLNNPAAKFNFCTDTVPDRHRVEPGDLLFAWSGTPGTSFGAHIWNGPTAWLNQHIFRVGFDAENLDKRFLRLAMNVNLNEYIRAAHGGAGLAHITKGVFEASVLLIPPLAEQRRIVAKVEELVSDLDAAVAALERVRVRLKRYRAAVLKAAIDGKLTEEWRSRHPDTEPASALLDRILGERRRRWEDAQRAKFTAAGKEPPKGWQAKYPEPAPVEADGLPPLPSGWCWATLGSLGDLDRGRSRHRPRNAAHLYGGPYPFIQTGDVGRANGLIRSYTQTYNEAGLQQSRLWPAGTLCITIAANIAESAILGFDACFPDSVVGFLPSEATTSRFIHVYLQVVQKRLEALAPATAQKNINLEVLDGLAVPVPPLAEQAAITEEVERRLSVVDQVSAQVEANLVRAGRLRQGILKRAFEGRLVPQDPADEPASMLLDRIRHQRGQPTPNRVAKPGRRTGRSSSPKSSQSESPGEG